MMLLWVSAIIYIELMALSLSLGAPKTGVQFRCALNMTLLCVFATIALELMAISLGLGASGAHEVTPCPLIVQTSPIVASISHISAVYGPIGLCFGYDAPIGPFYHKFRAREPID